MEQRSITHADSHAGEIDPRVALAVWLKSARSKRRMSVDDVARVTKIQARFLEKLEAGEIEAGTNGMPAEVFVRGFVRSFARCVGLDESEALERYQAIERGGGVPAARALVDSMIAANEPELEPVLAADPVTATVTATATASEEAPKKKRSRRKADPNAPRAPRKKKSTTAPPPTPTLDAAPPEPASATVIPAEPWKPTMPPAPPPSPPITGSPLPWRRPAHLASPASSLPNLPSLVIDDADPDRAERVREARAKSRSVSFLPPILLDRDQQSDAGSQRGLTLAVIILLIAATLTLSYLMRRPSTHGDGVTTIDLVGEQLA